VLKPLLGLQPFSGTGNQGTQATFSLSQFLFLIEASNDRADGGEREPEGLPTHLRVAKKGDKEGASGLDLYSWPLQGE